MKDKRKEFFIQNQFVSRKNLDNLFQNACHVGNIESVQEIINAELVNFCDLESAFLLACRLNHLPIVKLLMHSPKIKKQASMYYSCYQGHYYVEAAPFVLAYFDHCDAVVQYFIDDMNIQLSINHLEHLPFHQQEEVLLLLKKRDLKLKLQDTLSDQNNIYPLKMKL